MFFVFAHFFDLSSYSSRSDGRRSKRSEVYKFAGIYLMVVAPATNTFSASRGCPLMGALTVLLLSSLLAGVMKASLIRVKKKKIARARLTS